MAANFQDGRHHYHIRFRLKMAAGSQTGDTGELVIYSNRQTVKLMEHEMSLKCSFQYGRQFRRWPPWAKLLYYHLLSKCQQAAKKYDFVKLTCLVCVMHIQYHRH